MASMLEIADAQVRLTYALVTQRTPPGNPLRIRRPRPPSEGKRMPRPEDLRRLFGSAIRYVPREGA
jgi:hypothetical protein